MNVYQMERSARIFVAGHRGLVGSAVMRHLRAEGYENSAHRHPRAARSSRSGGGELLVPCHRPEYVFLVAGTVGGILANSTRPAEFLYDNMMIHGTVVHAAHLYGVKRLLYLGSSCIYPRECPQPMKEEYLLSGPLESTNEAYALAKIAGIKLCQSYRQQYGCDFIAAMPTNLYGPQDNFDLTSSHVLPALMRKFHDAKVAGRDEVVIWGTGTPRREFLHVDDLADACLFLMEHYARRYPHVCNPTETVRMARLLEKARITKRMTICNATTLRFETQALPVVSGQSETSPTIGTAERPFTRTYVISTSCACAWFKLGVKPPRRQGEKAAVAGRVKPLWPPVHRS